jgi:hypothetical protein
MRSERDGHSQPVARLVSDERGAEGATAPQAWRAPTITRLSLERTLDFSGTHTDLNMTGSTIG